jgi:ornithine cyclodeaminase/alanine dehydrogenase-like protein (mu-crystallin family)
MPVFLTHEEVDSLLTMKDTLDVLEKAYTDLGSGRAITRPRSDIIIPRYTNWPDAVYGFKTMDGAVPELGYAAIRLNSDIVHWPEKEGKQFREKIPAMPGQRWMALVLLFSVKNGEFLAMMPDGVVQRNRVGGTNGLGAKYMARQDAGVYGLFGTGWQAGGQLMAITAVRDFSLVKVYSRNSENRKKFCDHWGKKLNIEIKPVDTPVEVVKDSDIVGLATNTIEPIFKTEWLEKGMHLTCVKPPECEPDVYRQVDRLAINFKQGFPHTYYLGQKKVDSLEKAWSTGKQMDLTHLPELGDLITGKKSPRENNDETNCFLNNIGLGFQFAAVAGRVYELAREKGIGKEMPLDWFTQPVHP